MKPTESMKLLPSVHRVAVDEVRRAYELINQLEFLIPFMELEQSRSELASALFGELFEAFTAAMSMLKAGEESTTGEIIIDQQRKNLKSSSKRVKLEAKDRKQLEKIITCAPHNDGYQWRKYGEKKIRNSMFTRCYYRCSNYEQNCPAKKQVQQDDHDLSLFHVSYQGKHSCNWIAAPWCILDSSLKEELSLISNEPIPSQKVQRMSISGCESWCELDSNTEREEVVEGSNCIDDIGSFDIEYGDLLLVSS